MLTDDDVTVQVQPSCERGVASEHLPVVNVLLRHCNSNRQQQTELSLRHLQATRLVEERLSRKQSQQEGAYADVEYCFSV